MAFDSGFLDELRARVGLGELIGRRVPLKRRGQEWTGLCPFHKEKTPSFTVNEAKGFYHCFGCGAHGSAIDFVMTTEGLSFPETVEKLAREVGLDLPAPNPEAAREDEQRKGLRELMVAVTEWFESHLVGMAGTEARRYLADRGLDEATIAAFRLGYAPNRREGLLQAMQARGFQEALLLETGLIRRPDDGGEPYDFFRDRIIFPIADRQARPVAFGGRALGEARAKYLNSPESPIFQKGRTLYNLARARQAAHEAGTVIVAEGYMDVIALHRAGVSHAVAPLGTAVTEEQLALLWRLAPEPVLCFDGDQAGKRAAHRVAERALPVLAPGRSLGFVELPPGEDPDSLLAGAGAEALRGLLAEPTPLVEVLWRGQVEGRALDTPERRAGLRRDLGRLAGQIGDETVREYYRQHFRQLLDRSFGQRRPEARAGRAPAGRWHAAGPAAFLRPLARHRGLGGEDALTGQRERLILAIVLNHPELLDEISEELGLLDFNTPTLDSLRRQILEHFGAHRALDVAALKANLTESALYNVIDQLTGVEAAKLAPSARAEASLDEARRGWRRICRIHQLSGLEAAIQAAQETWNEASTDENGARLLALQVELHRAKREATGIGEDGGWQ
ncbi:MAG: DNA primase [Alphaproteobacteria bacterium]|jgi:DNA primase|nr:DNA primase [Alphaproteobacteria bacterium]